MRGERKPAIHPPREMGCLRRHRRRRRKLGLFMAATTIRVLVVDDSTLIREIVSDCIAAAPGMEVAGKARNGREGLEMVEALRPDVVTLDMQMPVMDGLETLDAILRRQPTPVIMVSTLTQRGADITFEALDAGRSTTFPSPTGCSRLWHLGRSCSGRSVPRRGRTCGGLWKSVGREKPGKPRWPGKSPSSRRSLPRASSSLRPRAWRLAFRRAGRRRWRRCSRPWSRPCRRSSWCSTCRPSSPGPWLGG